jgi:hypothetical protein
MPEDQNKTKHKSLDQAVDKIREKFGKDSLKRGG